MTDNQGMLVIRATPAIVAMVLATAAFLSLAFVGGGLVIALRRSHPDWIWGGAAAGWAVGAATIFRLKARFDAEGIAVRNAFRSFAARWDEIHAIRIIPAVWYSSDFAWAASMLEIEATDGRRFPIRCCTHLSRSQVERLTALLRSRSGEYGFELPPSLLQLWKVNAVA